MVKKKLFQSSRDGNVEEVGNLLSSGVSPNCARDIDVFWWDKTTPLNVAVGHGHTDVVKLLLADSRVDPNTRRTDWKDTALIIAAKNKRVSVVKLLLRCPKVDTTYVDKQGDTALDEARKNGNIDIERAIESRQTLLRQGHTC